ncbi:MAG TPA: thioredoxin domain-containing protein [Candidatus Angelobacter sp.]|nr:thioredoxin domain-containing protein [Candidatus Angelobacter sp.]
MTHPEIKNRFLKAATIANLCGLLLLVFSSALYAQNSQSPSPKAKTDPAPSAASIRVSQPHDQVAPDKNWREEVVNNSKAPVTIIEFFDYQCPFCQKTNPAVEEAIKKHPGKVRLVLKNLPLSIHPDSALAHQAALAAGEQDRFWEMHDLLFANQSKIKLPDLLLYAQQLHLDVPRFQKALESGRFRHVLDDDRAMARGLGISATPSFFINGRSFIGLQNAYQLNAAIDEALNPATAPAVAATAPASPVAVGNLDLSRAPARGQSQAPVTIIEFSDLQCPFCAKVTPTLQELMKQYPDQVRWVFKSFPLDFHADSPLAHAAALAAERQGKFWEMHDLIFANQHNLKRDNLLAEARSLNLDMDRFTADLDGADVKKQLEADKKEGQGLGVDGTPAFFINGKSFSGAMPMEQFQAAINNALAALGKPALPSIPAAESTIARKEPEISFGSPDSPITLAWFSDLQSGLSPKATLLVRKLIDSHPGQIRLVFKNRPLDIHPGAMLLHEAAMAANAQGKFWQMHDLIIANPQKASRQDMLAYAKSIGLDAALFQKDLDSEKYRSLIEEDLQEAQRRAVLGSPVFFFNSARVDGVQNEKLYRDIIEDQLAAKK